MTRDTEVIVKSSKIAGFVYKNTSFLKKAITDEAGEEAMRFISEQIDLNKENTILLLSPRESTYATVNQDHVRTVIDLRKVNSQNDLNAYFRFVNNTLPDAGIYIGCVESNIERKERFYAKFPPFLAKIAWVIDFILHRVCPKIAVTKYIYALFSGGRYNVISRAETLGRLNYAGFEIIGHSKINNLFYFSVIKTKEPKNDTNPSYGILFKMKRISKDGKMIGVYKIRTMHPYSEYIQDYVVKLNGYNKVGKPNNDFRLTSWGKLIRKLHLDEIPQLINVLKGELNIVGVRPLSKFGFESLPPDLQTERIKYKPGCIPPNVSLGITGFNGVIKAERIYLREIKKNKLITNFKYFWMAIFNIIRSKNVSA